MQRRPMVGPPEVIVKIDDGIDSNPSTNMNGRRRESNTSLDFWGDDANKAMQPQQQEERGLLEDPPSKLIGQFLNMQKAAGVERSVDVDLEMDEFRRDPNLSSKDLKVSREIPFPSSGGNNVVDIGPDRSSSDEDENERALSLRRRYSNVIGNADGIGNDSSQVLRCTSIQRRMSGLGRMKTKSRLMDPPEYLERRSESMMRSFQIRSGMTGRASGLLGKTGEDEDEDPLFDEDIPEEFKKAKFDALTIAQWISLVMLVTALGCTLAISGWKRRKLNGMSLWKWEVLILVLICGRLVSGWVIRIIVFFIERNFFMRKRVLYFVYGVRKAVQNCFWLGLVLVAWHFMLDEKVEKTDLLRFLNKLMLCLVMGMLLWLVKTVMVKVLASSFHVSNFFDRIQESLFNQYVIETLSGPPLIEIRNQREEEDRTVAEVWRLQNAGATLPPDLRSPVFQPTKSGKVADTAPGGLPPRAPRVVSFKNSGQLVRNQDDQGISIDQLHKLNHKNISAWNMKRLMKVVKKGVLTTLDERVLDSSQYDETTTQIRSEREAKAAARKIFRNVAKPKAKFIYLEDLTRFLQEEEALKTLNIVEGSTESEKISKASLKAWVVNAFMERRALALTLNDTKTAVDKLHHIVNVIVGILILLISLIILDIASGKFLLYVSSQFVVVAFIFGNTCKTIFEAVIFVFVIHPFDVGDRCEIDGEQMIVEEMNILTTIFLRFDNQKIIYPNVTLATRPIHNYYRSPDMGDSVEFAVHVATPAEKIAVMKQRITSYIEEKSEHWYPAPSVIIMNLEGLNAMKMSVWLRHRINHQNMAERYKRRSILIEEMVKIFKELDMEYRLYPIDINVRAMPSLNSGRIPSSWNPPPGN